ncbi:MAG: autotransporter domain-containing protein [Alphaproteobacteria bacterium]|nr:autotransporter domain-containing protein [Alphaproteobacteria bacterium]
MLQALLAAVIGFCGILGVDDAVARSTQFRINTTGPDATFSFAGSTSAGVSLFNAIFVNAFACLNPATTVGGTVLCNAAGAVQIGQTGNLVLNQAASSGNVFLNASCTDGTLTFTSSSPSGGTSGSLTMPNQAGTTPAFLCTFNNAQAAPQLSMGTVTPSPAIFTGAGQSIAFSVTVTNTGNTIVNTLALSDTLGSSYVCGATTLNPGANTTCTGTYVTTAGDASGMANLSNTTTAGATPVTGTLTPATGASTVTFVAAPSPALSLSVVPSPGSFSTAGQSIAYTATVTNTGNNMISGLTVSGTRAGSYSCLATSLAPTASTTCTASYLTTSGDVSAAVSLSDTSTANGTPAAGTLTPPSAVTSVSYVANLGTVTIALTSSGRDDTYGFVSTLPGGASFSLTSASGTAQRVFANVPGGTYTVTQNAAPGGMSFTGLTCSSGGSVSGMTATVTVTPSSSVTCTFANAFDTLKVQQQTLKTIAEFVSHRMELLTGTGSDFGDIAGRFGEETVFGERGGGSRVASRPYKIAANAGDGAGYFVASANVTSLLDRGAASDWTVWVELQGAFSSFDGDVHSADTTFASLDVGVDYRLMPGLIAGAFAQYDRADTEIFDAALDVNTTVTGGGWLVGPYVGVQLAPQLYFTSRVAIGASGNEVKPFGTYEDHFTTRRNLYEATLSGSFTALDDIRIVPSVRVIHFDERQDGYRDSLGVNIPEQDFSVTRAEAGPEISTRFMAGETTAIEPRLLAHLLYDFQKNAGTVANDDLTASEGSFLARFGAGLDVTMQGGLKLRSMVSYDGLGSGSGEFEAWRGDLSLSLPF